MPNNNEFLKGEIMKYLSSIIIVFGLLGCVTAESVKTISDYDLCLNHSEPKISESVWQVYDDELQSRKSLDCNVYAKRIAEYKERERKRAEALNNLSDSLNEIAEQQRVRVGNVNSNTVNINQGVTYILTDNYVSGSNRICIYKLGSQTATHTMKGMRMCPPSMKF